MTFTILLECSSVYTIGAEAFRSAFFGEGEGPILLDNVLCNGNEERLESCDHNGYEISNCDHGEDAGVRCMAAGTGELKNACMQLIAKVW